MTPPPIDPPISATPVIVDEHVFVDDADVNRPRGTDRALVNHDPTPPRPWRRPPVRQ